MHEFYWSIIFASGIWHELSQSVDRDESSVHVLIPPPSVNPCQEFLQWLYACPGLCRRPFPPLFEGCVDRNDEFQRFWMSDRLHCTITLSRSINCPWALCAFGEKPHTAQNEYCKIHIPRMCTHNTYCCYPKLQVFSPPLPTTVSALPTPAGPVRGHHPVPGSQAGSGPTPSGWPRPPLSCPRPGAPAPLCRRSTSGRQRWRSSWRHGSGRPAA